MKICHAHVLPPHELALGQFHRRTCWERVQQFESHPGIVDAAFRLIKQATPVLFSKRGALPGTKRWCQLLRTLPHERRVETNPHSCLSTKQKDDWLLQSIHDTRQRREPTTSCQLNQQTRADNHPFNRIHVVHSEAVEPKLVPGAQVPQLTSPNKVGSTEGGIVLQLPLEQDDWPKNMF